MAGSGKKAIVFNHRHARLIQAVLSGRNVLIKFKDGEIRSCCIEDLYNAQFSFCHDEAGGKTLKSGLFTSVRFRDSHTVYEQSVSSVNIIEIDYTEDADYSSRFRSNILALTALFQPNEQLSDYLAFCYERIRTDEEERSAEQNVKYSFQHEIKPYLDKAAHEVREYSGRYGQRPAVPAPLRAFLLSPEAPEPSDISDDPQMPYIFCAHEPDDTGTRIVHQAMRNGSISYVNGPPGTGKTATLADIIISAMLNGKTVLFAAKTNAAINEAIARCRKILNNLFPDNPMPVPFYRFANKEQQKQFSSELYTQYFLRLSALSSEADPEIPSRRRRVLSLSKDRDLIAALLRKRIRASAEALWKHCDELTPELIQNPNAVRAALSRLSRRSKFRETFLQVFPIVFSTCDSVVNVCRPNLSDPPFHLAIIDEASMCNIPDGLLPIMRAGSLVLSGDTRQLYPVITIDKQVIDNAYQAFNVSRIYHFQFSIMGSYRGADYFSADADRSFRLLDHRRCRPKIIAFSNSRYYQNTLNIRTKENRSVPPLQLIDIQDADIPYETEISLVVSEVSRLLENGMTEDDIGIISPYKLHADHLRSLAGVKWPGIKIGTIHEFQGNERNIIILTLGLNVQDSRRKRMVSGYRSKSRESYQEFLFRKRRELANVAVTRARESFILICNSVLLKQYSEYALKHDSPDTQAEEADSAVTAETDDMAALYDYVFENCGKNRRIISEPVSLPDVFSLSPSVTLIYKTVQEILNTKTYNVLPQKPHYTAEICTEDFTVSPDGLFIVIFDQDQNARPVLAFCRSDADGIRKFQNNARRNSFPVCVLGADEAFSKTPIFNAMQDVLVPAPLQDPQSMQFYISSGWISQIFMNQTYHPDVWYSDRRNPEIRYCFKSPKNELRLEWYDKCVLDVFYTKYRSGINTVSLSCIYTALTADSKKRLTPSSKKQLCDSIKRLSSAVITIRRPRDLAPYITETAEVSAPLLNIKKKNSRYEFVTGNLRTDMPLCSIAEELSKVFVLQNTEINIDPDSTASEAFKAGAHKPNDYWLITRYLLSRIRAVSGSPLRQQLHSAYNDIVLFERRPGFPDRDFGNLSSIGLPVNDRDQITLNRRGAYRTFLRNLLEYYRKTGLITGYYFYRTAQNSEHLMFSVIYSPVNESDFVTEKKNRNSKTRRPDMIYDLAPELAADIIFSRFYYGISAEHIARCLSRQTGKTYTPEDICLFMNQFAGDVRSLYSTRLFEPLLRAPVVIEQIIRSDNRASSGTAVYICLQAKGTAENGGHSLAVYNCFSNLNDQIFSSSEFYKKYSGYLVRNQLQSLLLPAGKKASERIAVNWKSILKEIKHALEVCPKKYLPESENSSSPKYRAYTQMKELERLAGDIIARSSGREINEETRAELKNDIQKFYSIAAAVSAPNTWKEAEIITDPFRKASGNEAAVIMQAMKRFLSEQNSLVSSCSTETPIEEAFIRTALSEKQVGSKTIRPSQNSAVILSLIASAKANQTDIRSYLKELCILLKQIHEQETAAAEQNGGTLKREDAIAVKKARASLPAPWEYHPDQ